MKLRLELFVAALYGSCPIIVPADPPPALNGLRALAQFHLRRPASRVALAATDGVHLFLPRSIEPSRGDAGDLALLRLLALEMAARVARGSVSYLPQDALTRDLYALAEASAIDRALAQDLPGFAVELATERERCLLNRPALGRLSACEHELEQLARCVLAGECPEPELAANTPEANLTWARARAAACGDSRSYRGLTPVLLWGRMTPPLQAAAARASSEPSSSRRPHRSQALPRTPRARTEPEPADPSPGAFVVKPNAAENSVEDPRGLSRPNDRELAPDLADLAEAIAELPEAQLVQSDASVHETLVSDALPRTAAARRELKQRAGHVYPEWDCFGGFYRPAGALVREQAPLLGDLAFARAALRRHAALVRQVRQRFERLRLRRLRSTRQLDGDAIDIEAYVAGFADRLAGQACDDRLYETSRPLRRELATCVVLDASASTDAWVSGQQRIIDIEKDALLVVSEAFERLADSYAILSFSGESAAAVDVVTLKGFAERGGELVQRRIAGIEPDRYTRAGAALRHATALLSAQPAHKRLLLLLSDGKPNDVDEYEGRYGVEDVRQAVVEARLAGIHVFCLAVDRAAPQYAPRIFGPQGFALLRYPQRLPQALVELVRLLVTH